jgi:hypothetical protein
MEQETNLCVLVGLSDGGKRARNGRSPTPDGFHWKPSSLEVSVSLHVKIYLKTVQSFLQKLKRRLSCDPKMNMCVHERTVYKESQ